jgi:hypothetical protein
VRYDYRSGPDYDRVVLADESISKSCTKLMQRPIIPQVPRIFAHPSHLGPHLPHAARQFLRRLDIVAESHMASAFAPNRLF